MARKGTPGHQASRTEATDEEEGPEHTEGVGAQPEWTLKN